MLDEPLGALDLKLRKELQDFLKQVQREVGITFVYVTHDQEEAFSMSDRVAVMQHGRIEQIGRPQDVYQRPETLAVASFVGAANRLPGRIVDLDGRPLPGRPRRARNVERPRCPRSRGRRRGDRSGST